MLIVDTGYFYALADRRDRHHARAVEVLGQIAEPLITTWPVLTETTHLLNQRLGTSVTTLFMRNLADGFCAVHQTDPAELRRIADLMVQYADLPVDLADASLVLLAEHLGEGRILSTDLRDFGAYRFKDSKPFRNLLLA